MYQCLIRGSARTLRLTILLIVVSAVAGCATVTSDELIPKPFTLPASRQTFVGSVHVNVMLDLESIHIIRPRELVNLNILAAYLNVPKETLWKAMALDDVEVGWFYADLRRNMYMVAFSNYELNSFPFGRIRSGTGNTEPLAWNYDYARFVDNLMKDALEKSIISNNLFTGVAQAQTDYVLDVWVDRINAQRPFTGFGEYACDVYSIWRLTRGRDGKVLACDFVFGRGINSSPGFEPSKRSYNAAVRDMINKGLGMLFDRSQEHLNALVPAGLNRPSMGKALPEGAERWNERIRQNWQKLQKGMTIDEVETVIGPVRINNNAWDYHYILPVRSLASKTEPKGNLGELDFIEYKTSLYSLVFMEVKGYASVPRHTHKLLIWELKKK